MFHNQQNQPYIIDQDIIESLDADGSKKLFRGLPNSKPTLREALEVAEVSDIEYILRDSAEFSALALERPEIAALGLTKDEAGAITCYTLQAKGGKKSPYQIINEGIAGTRNRAGLYYTRKLIYLLLSGLRKLSRFRPPTKEVYRGVGIKVPQNILEACGHQYYEKGKIVTWWGFTSTSINLEATNKFVEGVELSTLFTVKGDDLWGYYVKPFSPFEDEEEIIIEPEAKVLVNAVTTLGRSLVIQVILQPFEHLVLEDVIPPKLENPKKKHSSSKKTWDKCSWKTCPDKVDDKRKYSLSKKKKVVTKINEDFDCTVIGNMHIPSGKTVLWNIKILNSKENDCKGILIGVAPHNINQNEDSNFDRCGWYFDCFDSALWSGPPHNYGDEECGLSYGNRIEENEGKYVHIGDTVGVVMDMTKGKLLYTLNGVSLGIAFEGIPLDKPLVPCVLLYYEGDSVEFEISDEKKEYRKSLRHKEEVF